MSRSKYRWIYKKTAIPVGRHILFLKQMLENSRTKDGFNIKILLTTFSHPNAHPCT
jgi:hypothetical protein